MKVRCKGFLSFVSLLICAVMCFSVFPFSVMAEENYVSQTSENTGPADKSAYIALKLREADSSYQYLYTTAKGVLDRVGDDDSYAYYDPDTNTLILENFKAYRFEINKMGEDFKIVLKGESKLLGDMKLWGDQWGCSAHISGDGTLSADGISIAAEGSSSVLSIGENVCIDSSSPISVYGSKASDPLIVQGRERSKGRVSNPRLKQSVAHWYYNLDSNSYGDIYHNPEKPYSQHSQFAETEYFMVNTSLSRVRRRSDMLEHDAVQFSIYAVDLDEQGRFILKTSLTSEYVWDDSLLYKTFEDDPLQMTISDYDPDYQYIEPEGVDLNTLTIVDLSGNTMESPEIVPENSAVLNRPVIDDAVLPQGTQRIAYNAKLSAQPGNQGGSIVDYTIHGTASKWLMIDKNGNLYGTPTSFGIYKATINAIEDKNGERVSSVSKDFNIRIGPPDRYLTFNETVNDGFMHVLTFINNDSNETKTYNLGKRDLMPSTVIDLSDFESGSYTVTFTAEATGAVVTYSNNTKDFEISEKGRTVVVLSPSDAEVAYTEKSLFLTVNNFGLLSDIGSITAKFTLSNGKELTKSVLKKMSVFPNVVDEGVTITSVELTGKDDIGQEVSLMSGNAYIDSNSASVEAYTYNYKSYSVYGIPSALKGALIKLNINGIDLFYTPSTNIVLKNVTDQDELKWVSISKISQSELLSYDFDNAQFTYSSGSFEVSIPTFKRNASITGVISDEKGNPLKGVSIIYEQNVNGYNNSAAAATDSQGAYTLKNLIAGRAAEVRASLTGFYPSNEKAADVQPGTVLDIVLKKQSAVTVYTDTDAYNACFKWNGADSGEMKASASGSVFTLPLNKPGVNGNIKVTMTSDSTSGTASGTVKVSDGCGVLRLSPVKKGTIDWSGYDKDGNETQNYSSYIIEVDGIRMPVGSTFKDTDPGKHKIDIRDFVSNDLIASQNLTVKSGETVYLNVIIPDSASTLQKNSATVTGPETATTGEVVKISGMITSISGKKIEALGFFYDKVDYTTSASYAIINGSRVSIDHGWAYRRDNSDVDWSLPLNFTAYTSQHADLNNPVQNNIVMMKISNGSEQTEILAGSVSTRYVPDLTLKTASAVSSTKIKDVDGTAHDYPDTVVFSGTAPANTNISLYDNDVLCATVISNSKGNFEGKLSLFSSDVFHILKAQCTLNGTTVSATTKCSYYPGGAALTELLLNSQNLPLDGRRTSYVITSLNSLCFTAAFKNPGMLDDITYTIKGKSITDKVFFLFKTDGGPKIVHGEQISDTRWSTGEFESGSAYITGVEVLYKSKIKDYSAVDEYTDVDGSKEQIDVEYAMKRTGVEALEGGAYNGTYDYKALAREYLDKSTRVSVTGEGEEEDEDEDPDDLTDYSSNDIYRAVCEVYNAGEGPGRYETLTAQQAAQNCPSDKAEIRTYTDAPQYTFSSQNLKLRFDELANKKYKAYSYVDEASGHKMYMFSGTFYYGADALPVPSVQIEKVYSGIKHIEDDPRLYYNGKLVGSKLEVVYICDVTGKTWYRSQTAYIPAKAKSPIHTSAWQIPSVFEAPFSYKDTNVFPVNADKGSGIAQTGAGESQAKTGEPVISGFKFSIDFSKVTAKTYTSGVLSLGGYGASKIASSTYFIDKTKMLKLDSRTCKIMNATDEMIDFANYEGKNIFYVGVTQESTISAGVMYTLGEINNEINPGSQTVDDAYKTIETQLRDNMRYWGTVKTAASKVDATNNYGAIGDFSYDKVRADRMIEKTRKMADSLTELQKTIEDAQNQNEFTSGVTEKTAYVSLFASIVPGVGSETSLVLDACCFLLNAANDTNNAKVKEACEKFMQDYKSYVATDQEYKDEIKKDEENIKWHQKQGSSIKSRSDCADGKDFSDDPIDSSILGASQGAQVEPVHDPSGIVYEAVLSNPVEGAEVTLSKYESDSDPLSLWDDSDHLGQSNPLLTDENGYYRWDVPEGEWYVTASKNGYDPGSSQNDIEAVITHGDRNYLPVLPPQLDVNIPLISYQPPEVQSVSAKTDGVYITFSKYMNENDLIKKNFTLTDSAGNDISFKVEKLDSEKAPSNIRYDSNTPSYTKNILLSCSLKNNSGVSLRINGDLRSYADVYMTAPFEADATVESKKILSAPEFSVPSGEIDEGTIVTLTSLDGADIIYTTDGTEPTKENSTRVKSGTKISLMIDTVIKAVCTDSKAKDSSLAEASYSISKTTVDPQEDIKPRLLGDTDTDDLVTIADVTCIQYRLAQIMVEPYDEKAADTDGDGKTTISDATVIQQWLAHIKISYSVGEPIK